MDSPTNCKNPGYLTIDRVLTNLIGNKCLYGDLYTCKVIYNCFTQTHDF